MIFKGEPLAYIHISTKRVKKRMKTRGVQFDENGFFETDNEGLIRILSARLEAVSCDTVTEATEQSTSDLIQETISELKHCKKCDFTCDNQGELLAHYRSEHPKNKGDK